MKGALVRKVVAGLSVLLLAGWSAFAGSQESGEVQVYRSHAIAMHGSPKYPAGFAHFDYVDPNAPAGGSIALSAYGSYNSFNPFILKGRPPAAGIGRLFESLTVSSSDEAFTEYGLLAETIEWPEDRSWVAYTLRPEARWHDGKPITVEDVIWSLETFKTKAHPFYRTYFGAIASAEKTDERKVLFKFEGPPNPELPLITGQMPILPKHYWETRDFEEPLKDPPLGSGPYMVKRFDFGSSVTYERVNNYWGWNVPAQAGQYNFQEIQYVYFREENVMREGLKAGNIDFFQENTAKEWATGYSIPAVKEGRLVKRLIPNDLPEGMQSYAFNTRREIFADAKTREALSYAFDFEWTNANLFYGAYTRTRSYFSNTELASGGLPTGEELEVLESLRDKIPPRVFTETYAPPVTDGSGNLRGNLRTALRLLREAGWEIVDGVLTHKEKELTMEFEILLVSEGFERICGPFKENLKKLGIEVEVRTVDTAQYQNRLNEFDYDMIVRSWGQSLSPGNEQRSMWHSSQADEPGSRNFVGIRNPAVDELVELVITAPNRESLVARTRALDRVLLWNHYVIPQWHFNAFRVLYWDKFGMPETRPKYALGFDSWWIDEERETALNEGTTAPTEQ